MKRFKIILWILVVAVIAMQFIQPVRNKTRQILPIDFAKIYAVPPAIQAILQNACYDCHSNCTRYPWYVNTQPMAWIMAGHIKNGKEVLNFSEFGSYSARRQISKLRGIVNSIKDDIMPLSSYKIMHKSANLSAADKALFMNWMMDKADSLSQLGN